jgi:outer membrane protein
MKKTTWIALVLVSLFLQSCKDKNGGSTPSVPVVATKDAADAVKAVTSAGANIAYVNIDSLQEKYTWFKQQKASFEQKQKNFESSIESKARSLQGEMVALQQKAQQGTTPPAELQKEEQSLMQKQQSLGEERDRKAKGLIDETAKFNENLQKKVHEVLVQLQKDKGFDFVVSYSKNGGSPFLYVNDKLDITNEVLAVLNASKVQ